MRTLSVILALAALVLITSPAMATHSEHGCFNCHVPHYAGLEGDADASHSVPLWSTRKTEDGLPTYELYSSKGFDALATDIGQPDGATKLCLGCHDGSYSRVSAAHTFGTEDLKRTHPVSFTYDTALASRHPLGTLRDPAVADAGMGNGQTIAQALLDSKGKMQCTSCHDVHTSGFGDFMLKWDMPLLADAEGNVVGIDAEEDLCTICHDK